MLCFFLCPQGDGLSVTKDDLLVAAKASVNPIGPDQALHWLAQGLALDM